MSYGLYDGDLRFYARVPFFNLELMKIATYYKRRHEIVSLSPQFTPQFYSHFLIRQDYYGNTGYDIDPNTDISKFSFHGRAFDGKQYKPLPLEIERCKPDIHLYDKIEDQIVVNPTAFPPCISAVSESPINTISSVFTGDTASKHFSKKLFCGLCMPCDSKFIMPLTNGIIPETVSLFTC